MYVANQKTASLKKPEPLPRKKPQRESLLEANRSQNVAIAKKRLPMTNDEIKKAISVWVHIHVVYFDENTRLSFLHKWCNKQSSHRERQILWGSVSCTDMPWTFMIYTYMTYVSWSVSHAQQLQWLLNRCTSYCNWKFPNIESEYACYVCTVCTCTYLVNVFLTGGVVL